MIDPYVLIMVVKLFVLTPIKEDLDLFVRVVTEQDLTRARGAISGQWQTDLLKYILTLPHILQKE